MDFFNKLGDTLVEAGNVAGEKAKEVSEVTKLKMKIKKDETMIHNIYASMGEAVYRSIKREEAYPDLSDSIKGIEDLKSDIKLCREYIRAIKGVEICNACGQEVEVDSSFCKHCGAAID